MQAEVDRVSRMRDKISELSQRVEDLEVKLAEAYAEIERLVALRK